MTLDKMYICISSNTFGASYALTDSLSVFADYVQLCNADDSESWDEDGYIGEENWDDTVYTINIGLTYKF